MALYTVTTQEEFEEKVIKNSKLVLVDFWAQWCPPCRMMAPVLDTVAKKMDADVDVVKVDVEASPNNTALSEKYEVQGIPNLQIFKNGERVEQLVGVRPQMVLEEDLKKYLEKK